MNTKTKGKGELTEQSMASLADNKRHKTLTAPIRAEERFSGFNNSKVAASTFFETRTTTTEPMTAATAAATIVVEEELSPLSIFKGVENLVNDVDFQEKHKCKIAPLAIMAFASVVSEQIIRHKDKELVYKYFRGIEIEVPVCHEGNNNPHYHSITGQKLLFVDWERTHGIQVPCPDPSCLGTLKTERSNFSKNKTLFPIYNLNGAPTWCVVMRLDCPCCGRNFKSNEADMLVNLPAYAANLCPVESVYALPNTNCHLARQATDVFASIMVTYGNGELCSKLLFNAINRDYIRRVTSYYSMAKEKKGLVTTNYLVKDGEFIKDFPPLGDSVRDMYDAAALSSKNTWCVSDHDRHVREIQAVKCDSIFAQDHTFQVTKNYNNKGKLGAVAIWDVATATGEIASAALVPSTKTEHFAHAAQQLFEEAYVPAKGKVEQHLAIEKRILVCHMSWYRRAAGSVPLPEAHCQYPSEETR